MDHRIEDQSKSTHPIALWLLKALLLVLGVSALVPGIELILDPTGRLVQFPVGALEGSPFSDYLIPGFLLTIFIGLLPLAAWFALWKKPDSAFLNRINPFPRRHWAWTLALMSGLGLMTWIFVQMTMVPYFFLQPLMLSWGAAIVLLCLVPDVRVFYTPLSGQE
ncbi:MAG: hypothetical protein Q7T20_08345 [Saprospiraceae bacterium]|nr:hypothetical protein [Saprospiraceae bacterium]